ncbi:MULTISPECIES: 3-dehydroquinate synthase [unclassified Aureimonas]|uniref:3-dehydroquinate synthase n=1 Tax=unclassified Aureimonas TaxID=2615206 RepID=UPI0007014D2F|nr:MULTISPECIES: 3-dehydroquinate synthase [unclassified Aureimonas]KQT53994.1 3-dehydroquinate synthase [Aureimonas sp. Leaf427]KQT71566.1 3-dehydroquinate synthase [Aureimonas sp. Leaf460]
MVPAPTTVHVPLGERAYDILIGPKLIEAAGARIAERLPGARVAIVTDATVAALHLPRLRLSLAASNVEFAEIVLPAGETTKSWAHLQEAAEGVIAAKLERGDAVLALGGGVIGDLAGFVAGIVRRGMHFVQMPTTLLSQVDSSVGGKTGINSPQGKNLLGIFNQPQLVLADTAALDTLSPREFAAGYAEVVKYGLIDRPDFFAWLETAWPEIYAGGPARIEAIAASCRAKAEVVVADEREEGRRALLNLGHTFGHALESACRYDAERLVHGEAVSIGMVLAHRFSVRQGLASGQDAGRIEAHLAGAGLPTRIGQIPGAGFSVPELMDKIAQDKKVSRGRLTFILTRGIGEAFIARDVDPSDVAAFLGEELGR